MVSQRSCQSPLLIRGLRCAPYYSARSIAYPRLAGIVSPVAFGLVLDLTGDWTYPFLASIILLCLGAAILPAIHPDTPFVAAYGATS